MDGTGARPSRPSLWRNRVSRYPIKERRVGVPLRFHSAERTTQSVERESGNNGSSLGGTVVVGSTSYPDFLRTDGDEGRTHGAKGTTKFLFLKGHPPFLR